jgi:steroid 5-alpha reductase family enzyme
LTGKEEYEPDEEEQHVSYMKHLMNKMRGREDYEEEEVPEGFFSKSMYMAKKWVNRFETMTALGTSLYLSWACVTLLWIYSIFKKDASVIDAFWGFGFVIQAWTYFFTLPGGLLTRKLLITTLCTIYGARLSLHIIKRNWGKEEDFRYQQLRNQEGSSFWWKSYFNTFLLQGFVMFLISFPLMFAQRAKNEEGRLLFTDYFGLLLWAVGFYFESVADHQLEEFNRLHGNSPNVFLHEGLWKYSRHPNYFGDSLQWWGFFFIALGAPDGFYSILSPILMTFLLRQISGVPAIEPEMLKHKPGYEDYIRNTNAFFPGLPKVELPSDDQPKFMIGGAGPLLQGGRSAHPSVQQAVDTTKGMVQEVEKKMT